MSHFNENVRTEMGVMLTRLFLFLYSVLWVLCLPLVFVRLYRRGRREPLYRQYWAERLGIYTETFQENVIWLHAVSVGEVRAAQPIVDALLKEYPSYKMVLTLMTAGGRVTAQQLFEQHRNRVKVVYVPYDIRFFVRRFLVCFSPKICLLMETEIWPNLIEECYKNAVPVIVLNARLSERSYQQLQKYRFIMDAALKKITYIFAQTKSDEMRFRQLGIQQISCVGSVKFDVHVEEKFITLGKKWKTHWKNRKIILCASTRAGEEKLILEKFSHIRIQHPELLLVLVPRHTNRFEEVRKMVVHTGLSVICRSDFETMQNKESAPVDVILGDSMGEMFAYYAMCDVSFVGGSLLPFGGQNLIEAIFLEKFVLVGPHTFNFEIITQEAILSEIALRIETATQLMQVAIQYLGDISWQKNLSLKSQNFLDQHRGATARTIESLGLWLKKENV
jgi:3-deoxy-D-manno-octulosonic-acid transferase